jgi:cell division protein FtsI (penicillin-binding protein 3)
MLVRATAVRKNGEQGGSLPPVTIAAPEFGLKENEIKRYGAVVGLYKHIQCGLPSSVFDSTGQHKRKVRADERGISAIQLAVTAASLINGGWRVTPYVLDSVYDHSHDVYFTRSKDFDTAGRRRIMSPSMGIMIRRELLQQTKPAAKNYLVYTDSVSQVVMEEERSRYIIQDMMLGVIPAKLPQLMLLVVSQQDYLYPLPKGDKKDVHSLVEIGSNLLPEMLALDEKNIIRDEPDGRNQSNYNRFLISRRVDFRDLKESGFEPDSTMPQVTGLSLRKGLQRLNGHKFNVRVEGSGKIVMQRPAPGAPLNGAGECVLTLESEI